MDLNLKKNELVKFSAVPDAFPVEFKSFHRNFELLGAPIGDEAFCTSTFTKFVKERVTHSLEALQMVRDAQVFHYLIRLCCSICRVVHLLRTVPPVFCRPALEFFDSSVLESASRGLGILFPPNTVIQLALSCALGGLGLRRSVEHASAAYLASVARAASLDGWLASDAVGWDDALTDFRSRAGALPSCPLSGAKQRVLSAEVDKAMCVGLLESSFRLDRARLLSVRAPGASTWLCIIPSAALNQVFDSRQFTTLVRWWHARF